MALEEQLWEYRRNTMYITAYNIYGAPQGLSLTIETP